MGFGVKAGDTLRTEKATFLAYFDTITATKELAALSDKERCLRDTLIDAMSDEHVTTQSFVALCVHAYT